MSGFESLSMVKDAFLDLHPIAQAGFAGLFTWTITACGAGLVFFTKAVNQKLLDAMLGLSGGLMIGFTIMMVLDVALG